MSPLAFVVIGAEISAVLAMVLYAIVLTSLHREAMQNLQPAPRRDEIGLSLQAAAKHGFRLGILAVVVGSIYGRGLTCA